MRRSLLLAAALLALACSDTASPDDRWADPEKISFAPSLEIDLAAMTKTSSGLYYSDLAEGTGRAATLDDSVKVHLQGWLPDGVQIENTLSGPPLGSFVELFIPGVAEGITGMKVNGRRKLVIPPDLGWPNGHGPIPPRTTLVYEVRLMWLRL